MVGIFGVVGDLEYGIEALRGEPNTDDERTTTHVDDDVAIHVATHAQFHEEQPAAASDGSLVWVHGDTYGFAGPEGYESRDPTVTTDSGYCAGLYDEYGIDFVDGLNGEFAGVVLDRSDGTASVFTDKIGSVPLFYTRTEDAFLFSSRLQSVGLHPAVSPAFDEDHLAEYFAFQKAFGTATVLEDVHKVPPATVFDVDSDGSVDDRRVYWRPEYRPVDRTPDELAREVAGTMERVFEDRLREDLDYGVLLSGGSDSRLVLGCATRQGRSPTAYHMTNWTSRETRAAERVALEAGVDFRLLRRDADYHADLLERVPPTSNFVGAFNKHGPSGFEDELGEVDVLLTGYLGDTTFGRYPLYFGESPLPVSVPMLDDAVLWRYLPDLRRTPLPLEFSVERRVGSVPDYLDLYLDRYETPARVPAFLDAPDIRSVLADRMGSTSGDVHNHGVAYHSLRELQLCEYYPLTNQYAWSNTDSLRQIAGQWSPFFDDRLLDLHLSVPVRDRIHHSPINLALSERFPSLAAIPDGWSGVPPADAGHYGPKLLVRKTLERVRHRVAGDSPPEPFLSHRPWIDEAELIRNHDFLERAIRRNEDLIAALPFLDRERIDRCYRAHQRGENNWRELYALVTLLESPVAERVGFEG